MVHIFAFGTLLATLMQAVLSSPYILEESLVPVRHLLSNRAVKHDVKKSTCHYLAWRADGEQFYQATLLLLHADGWTDACTEEFIESFSAVCKESSSGRDPIWVRPIRNENGLCELRILLTSLNCIMPAAKCAVPEGLLPQQCVPVGFGARGF